MPISPKVGYGSFGVQEHYKSTVALAVLISSTWYELDNHPLAAHIGGHLGIRKGRLAREEPWRTRGIMARPVSERLVRAL